MGVGTVTHEGLKLVSTSEKFYLEPLSSSLQETLEIDRLNFELTLIDRSGVPSGRPDIEQREICALIGIIHLLAGPHLVVATDKRMVGTLEGHSVYEITAFDILPFSRTTIHLSEAQERDNQQYLTMVHQVLSTPGFYISYQYDLTQSVQRRHHLVQTRPHFSQLPLHERADERFVWNGHMLRDLVVQPELRRFIVPLMHGFVAIKNSTVNGKVFGFSIVSRRSCNRAGVRYYMRGLNDSGHAANYVETEQIVLYQGSIASFVQTRGSIPLYWSQRPTLKYKPTPRLNSAANQAQGIQKHFDEQIVHYGQQVVVDLIDQKGSEKGLGDAFRLYINGLASCLIGYNAFDFHKECSKMRWERLNLLINKLAPKQDEFMYFIMDSKGAVLSVQHGVFRTNCIDCLDRTNVVQSLLARRSLQQQLKRFGVLSDRESILEKKEFISTFKNVWADNADYCAIQYAGTGALKTDFTRTGARTRLGLLKDGYNSAIRYYYNNFYDGFKQDAIDLFLGNYIVDRWEGITQPSPFHASRSWKIRLVPIVFLFSVSLLFISLIIPSTNVYLQLFYVLFWGLCICVTLFFVYQYSTEFTDSPKLVQKDKAKSAR